MKAKLFEVKSGKNEGVYLKVSNHIPKEEQLRLLGPEGLGAGFICSGNVNFYKRHGAATNETLQSMDTFDQIATIWRLNPYGTKNKETMEYRGAKIEKLKNELDEVLRKTLYSIKRTERYVSRLSNACSV